MKTISISVNLYRFKELTTKAKEHAKDDFRENHGYVWADEAKDSLRGLAEYFGGKLLDWSIDYFNGSRSYAKFGTDELDPDDLESRLDALGTYDPVTFKGHGQCLLTGYCHDESVIDGFRKAFYADDVVDLDKLLQAGFKTWLEAVQADCADQFSDETFGEHCEANDYDFTADGELHAG